MVLDKSTDNHLSITCSSAKILFRFLFVLFCFFVCLSLLLFVCLFFVPVCTDGVNISAQKMEAVAKWTAWPCDDCNTREACNLYAAFKAVASDNWGRRSSAALSASGVVMLLTVVVIIVVMVVVVVVTGRLTVQRRGVFRDVVVGTETPVGSGMG